MTCYTEAMSESPKTPESLSPPLPPEPPQTPKSPSEPEKPQAETFNQLGIGAGDTIYDVAGNKGYIVGIKRSADNPNKGRVLVETTNPGGESRQGEVSMEHFVQLQHQITKVEKPKESSSAHEEVTESLDQKKERLDNLWANWEQVQNNPELAALFDRKQEYPFEREPGEILQEFGYPERTKIAGLQFENWKVALNPKFVKDGFMYVLRGDHPNLDKKGFYARTYGYAKLTTEQLAEQLHGADEAGYALYGDERFFTAASPRSKSPAEELALLQSVRGGSSFISATTSLLAAEAGTGNVPDAAEQLQYEIYVLKIPVDSVINSNTGNFYGMQEDEYLIPDYVSREEVVAKFPRGQTEEVYQYLHGLLGITKADLRMQEKTE